MFAFDGSLNLDFWEASRGFVNQMKASGKPLQFTYFMSGPYFISEPQKMLYYAPHHGYGHSAIGFGGVPSHIPTRLAEVNKAYQEGNEMGSHANSHYNGGSSDSDGERWNLDDWTLEFNQFWHFIFDALAVNGVKAAPGQPETGYLFDRSEVVGFRAPLLGTNNDMYTVLQANGFKYDTSKDDDPDYWPRKNKLGIWNFPLADLVISETGKKTLSMDYNFYITQSGGNEDVANKETYKRQMLATYLKYFQDNYNGNRAPVNIGHHFMQFNGGAYWEAMQEVAAQVCGMPEVRCVTYKTYMNWLDSLTPEALSAYRNGRFPKAAPVYLTSSQPGQVIPLRVAQKSDGSLMVHATVQDASVLQNYTAHFTVNNTTIAKSEISLQEVRRIVPQGQDAKITAHLVAKDTGIEFVRATQKLNNVGTDKESLDPGVLEDRAMRGDLPEAHQDIDGRAI
jgi:hypothetical protein